MADPASHIAPPFWKRTVGGLTLGIGLVVVGVFAAGGALMYPLLWDDYQLDQAVLAVALDWRDFGEERAHERLALEFAQRGIDGTVRVEDCSFVSGDERRVTCTWGVVIALPGEASWPMEFTSLARITSDGDLRW